VKRILCFKLTKPEKCDSKLRKFGNTTIWDHLQKRANVDLVKKVIKSNILKTIYKKLATKNINCANERR